MLENIFAAKMLEKSAKKYPGKYSKLLENEFSSNFSCLKKTLARHPGFSTNLASCCCPSLCPFTPPSGGNVSVEVSQLARRLKDGGNAGPGTFYDRHRLEALCSQRPAHVAVPRLAS